MRNLSRLHTIVKMLVENSATLPSLVLFHQDTFWWAGFAKHQTTHLKMTTVCLLVGPL